MSLYQKIRMKRLASVAILSGAVLCGSGCASHFESLPSRQEFRKSLYELQWQYPELTRCEPTFERHMCTPIWAMPYADDLIAKWGKPDKTRISWWNLISLPLLHPMSRWYWNIENKTIDVFIDRPILYGFEPHVFTLNIVENGRPSQPWIEPQSVRENTQQADVKIIAPSETDTFARLKALKELKDSGLLTEQEYESRRQALVNQL